MKPVFDVESRLKAFILELASQYENDNLHALAIKYITEQGEEFVLCGGCEGCLEEMLEEFTFEEVVKQELSVEGMTKQ